MMDRWKAVSRIVTSLDETQRDRIAGLEKRVAISERQPAAPKTAPRKHKSRKRKNRGSGSVNSSGMSNQKASTPRGNIV